MSNRLIADENGLFSCELQVSGPVLEDALEHENADDVILCAIIVALSALAQEDPWPDHLLDLISKFMTEMRDVLVDEILS
jgi:hypothetical protein